MEKDKNKFLTESISILTNTMHKNKTIVMEIILPALVNFIILDLLETCGKGSEMIDCVTSRQRGCTR